MLTPRQPMATNINQRATSTMNMDSTNPNQMHMQQILPNRAPWMSMPIGQIQSQITPGQQVMIQAPANTQMPVQVNMAGYTIIEARGSGYCVHVYGGKFNLRSLTLLASNLMKYREFVALKI